MGPASIGPPGARPPRSPSSGAALVLVLAVLVLAAAIGGISYALSVAGPPTSPPCDSCKPFVTLGTPVASPSGEEISIASLTEGRYTTTSSVSSFRVNLRFNGSYGLSAPMPSVNNGTASILNTSAYPTNFTVRWSDHDFDGRLGVGDSFAIGSTRGSLPVGAYTFFLIWSDGSLVASADFQSA